MIAVDWSLSLWVRLAAPIAWRDDARIAARLDGFAATEAGSALDMLKAAELTDEPLLRRLFFRHALDEARHATLFRQAARRLDPDPKRFANEHTLIHATRQNLYAELGPVRFLAFVYLAESRARAQFLALERLFEDRADLVELFQTVGRDERFHVAYTRWLLDRLRKEGHGRAVTLALAKVRLGRAWHAWRRAGRRIGDLVSRALLLLLYFSVVPVFALLERRLGADSHGWHFPPTKKPPFPPRSRAGTEPVIDTLDARLAEARRQH